LITRDLSITVLRQMLFNPSCHENTQNLFLRFLPPFLAAMLQKDPSELSNKDFMNLLDKVWFPLHPSIHFLFSLIFIIEIMANVRIWRNFSTLRQKMISNVNVENKKRDPIVFLLPWPIYFLRLRLKQRTA
jgi:hypothetical protein